MSTQSLRRAFGNDLAKMVLDEILFGRSRYYYFLGGIQPWNGFNGASVDDLPSTAAVAQTEALDRLYRSEIAYVKKISPNEVSLVAKRYNWTTDTLYAQWDHTLDMADQNFFVLTDEFNVYKCLNNNGGGLSTVKPTGRSIDPLRTSDSYIWKYMYNIPSFKRSRFSSVGYIPVQKALSDSFYNKGAVDIAIVEEEGAGYTYAPLVTLNVSNTTTGTGAAATVIIDGGVPGVGTITSIVITNGGSGYTKGVRVKFTSATGREAIGTAVVNALGVITGVTIAPGQGGVGYQSGNTTVSFIVGGAVLLPVVSTVTGSIVDVRIIDPGIGYLTAPVLTIIDGANTGTGKYGNAEAVFTAIVFNGVIEQVNTIDPGIGYSADTTTTISVQGDGTGATFTPIVYDNNDGNGGRLVDVFVETQGEGYTELFLTVNGPHTTRAKVSAIVKQSDFQSDQTIIEQTTVEGAIYSIKVSAPGAGYDPTTTSVTITGNGSGALATPVIINGSVNHIHVESFGSGYTFATIAIVDNRPGAVIESPAAAYAILPPIGGHGYDATSELLSNVLSISTPLKEELSLEQVLQDFRTFGIIKNPNNLLTGTRYKDPTGLLVFKMKFATNTSSLSRDEILLFGSNKYRVLEINGQEVFLIPLDNDAIAPLGTLTSTVNANSYNTIETLQPLNFDKYSGSLLYISSERPFSFSQEQSIVIKTFIKF